MKIEKGINGSLLSKRKEETQAVFHKSVGVLIRSILNNDNSAQLFLRGNTTF